jgi:hypothetical protein
MDVVDKETFDGPPQVVVEEDEVISLEDIIVIKGTEIMDRSYKTRNLTSEEWAKLTPDQQAKVRELRTNRDKMRNVQVIQNVKQRTDDGTVTTELTSATGAGSTTVGVGSTMSQQKNKSTNREV